MLDFKTVRRRPFGRTFLYYSEAQLDFAEPPPGYFEPGTADYENRYERYASYLAETFEVQGQREQFGKGTVVLSNQQDDPLGQIWLGAKGAGVRIGGSAYRGFNHDILYHMLMLRRYASQVLEVDRLEELSCEKFNLWRLTREQTNSQDVEELLKVLLSADLLQKATKVDPNREIDKRLERPCFKNLGSIEDSLENGTSCLILYGSVDWTVEQDTEVRRAIFLRLTMKRDASSLNYRGEDFEDTLTQLNQDLFNAFNWSVSRPVLAFMEQGTESRQNSDGRG